MPRSRKQRARTRDFRGGKRLRGHYTRLRKTSSRISTLNNSRKFARLPRSLLYGSQTSRAPKTLQAQKGPTSKNDCGAVRRYWMVLATEEKALLAFEPTRRIVPTTNTNITASITAYSAMSCPLSSDRVGGGYSFVCNSFQSRKFGL